MNSCLKVYLLSRQGGSGGPPPRRDSQGSIGPSTGAPVRRTSAAGREPIRSSSWSKDQALRPPLSASATPARSSSTLLSPNESKYPPEVLDKKIDSLLQEYLSARDLEVRHSVK